MRRRTKPQRRPTTNEVTRQTEGRFALTRSLEDNLEQLGQVFTGVSEFATRRIYSQHISLAVVFMSGLVDKPQLETQVIRPLESEHLEHGHIPKTFVSETRELGEFAQVVQAIIHGKAVLLVDGHQAAMQLNIDEKPSRSIDQPERERVILGPKESFTESLATNIALVRGRLRTPALKTERYFVGSASQVSVMLMYKEDTTDSSLVDAVRKSIQEYPSESLSHVTDLGELIETFRWSPFPQSLYTERPDVVSANLLEGRVVVFADGSSSALVTPIRFFQLFHSPEDYYIRPGLSSVIRLLRLLAFVLTTTATPAYVALVAYHYDMIPLRILTQIAAGRSNVPFSPVTEALVLDTGIELLREAGIRLPKPLGQTLGVAAALVVGQSVIAANFASPFLVVMVGFTALASFVIPNYSNFLALRFLRFPITLAAGFM